MGLNTQVLGISVDHIPCLQAWADHLGGISYPLLSDFWPHGEVSRCYDVFRSEGKSERAIFVIDTIGIVRYIDVHDIDQQPDNEELRSIVRRIDPEAAAHAGEEIAAIDAPLPHGGIVMYCTPWCDDCKKARSWLIQRGFKYTEVDISRNKRAAAQVREWAGGSQTTPTFDINGTIIVDFDPEKLTKALVIDKS